VARRSGVRPHLDRPKVGRELKARYVLKLVDKPGSLVPRLGLFVQGDFRGTIDWTSKAAESRPEIDLRGRSRAESRGGSSEMRVAADAGRVTT
jgi:hypothetical protein